MDSPWGKQAGCVHINFFGKYYKNVEKQLATSVYTSPLAGEEDFQFERASAKIRKSGEGYFSRHGLYTPHQEFLKLVPHFGILSSQSTKSTPSLLRLVPRQEEDLPQGARNAHA
jgi:hypothetical protein